MVGGGGDVMSVSECNECSVCIVGSQADEASSPACGAGAEAGYKKAVLLQ